MGGRGAAPCIRGLQSVHQLACGLPSGSSHRISSPTLAEKVIVYRRYPQSYYLQAVVTGSVYSVCEHGSPHAGISEAMGRR